MSEFQFQLATAFDELISQSTFEGGDILVVGCSTSEVLGGKIGTIGSLETATEIFSILKEKCQVNGLYLACQCCEHLNRALVVEKELAKAEHLTIVNAVPHEHAGGSFATAAYRGFENPVLVEEIKADLGIDIGQTFIGMHLKSVAVPVRTSIKTVGEAIVTFAKTRHKYIGGERAKYN